MGLQNRHQMVKKSLQIIFKFNIKATAIINTW